MKKILAAKILMFCLLVIVPAPAQAGIPVIDGGNLVQNIINVIQSIMRTVQQIEEYSTQIDQYRTQIDQYANQIQNTMSPATNTWDDAVGTVNNLMASLDTLNYYKTSLGSIDAYLQKFNDYDHYLNNTMTDSELQSLWKLSSESEKRANDALFRTLDSQQDALVSDASQLKTLQNNAQSANGQNEYLGYANQLASQQINQLLQLRAIALAQNNAIAAKMQAEADEVARDRATRQRLMNLNYAPMSNADKYKY